jgi:hypothetical protein
MLHRLPESPSLDHLKHQARDLLRELRDGEEDALSRAADHLPRRTQGEPPKLNDAQLIVAREYGYASWPKIRGHVELALAENPSLDHLKHQAWDLLRELRDGNADALTRAADHLPRRKQGEPPKLSHAQLIIAREYGYVSWPKMKGHVELLCAEPEVEPDDPPEVQMASVLLLGAMETPYPRFSLQREGVDLLMTLPDGDVAHVAGCLPSFPNGHLFAEWDLPLPTAKIWERFLKMAGLTDPSLASGMIRITRGRFPPTEWTIKVKRDGPDKLDFSLSLDRVDTTMPTRP